MDRYGFTHAYTDGSTKSASLLKLPFGELDYDALAVFIRLGYFIGESTAFRNIRYFGPTPWVTKPSRLGRAAAIEGYGELFHEAMKKRIPEGPNHTTA